MEEKEELLTFDKLCSGDRPSIYVFGITGAQAIRESKRAVFMVDVLGNIRLMPPESVKVLIHPRVSDRELDEMEEERAIEVMLAQGDSEEQIMDYLKKRNQER